MSSFAAESKTEGIKLISHEGESFSVPIEVAKMSALVSTMLSGDEEEDQDKEIPLPNVKAPILAKVIEFCKHHVTDPMTPFEKVWYIDPSFCIKAQKIVTHCSNSFYKITATERC